MAEWKPIVLHGQHIDLIPLASEHHERLCEIGLEPELWRLTTNELCTPEDMRAYIQTALNDRALGTSQPFVFVEKTSGLIVGSSRYHSLNRANRRLVIGHTWIAREWQRTVVNSEAKYLMLKHAFEELGCVRVEFLVNSINDRSRRALLRIGARHEAILRNYTVAKDQLPRNVALFSIINSKWPAVKANLGNKIESKRVERKTSAKESYDKVAAEYAVEFSDELNHKPFDRKLLNWLIEKVGALGPICDMGCGPGQIAKYLSDHGAEVRGVDLSPEMVRQAQLLHPEIAFEQGDMLALDKIADDALGGIAAFYSLIHVPRNFVVKALTEFKRVLRPGGCILMTHHIGSNSVHRNEWFGKEVALDFLFFETEEMKDYITRAGLILEEVIERDPYRDFEYPSRRAYTFARKE